MPDEQRYRLETLAAHHAVRNFRCGNIELDEYLREDALADMTREVTRTFFTTGHILPGTKSTRLSGVPPSVLRTQEFVQHEFASVGRLSGVIQTGVFNPWRECVR